MLQPDVNGGAPLVQKNEESGRPHLAEFKNGRVVLKQRLLTTERMSETMQGIVNFRNFMEQRSKLSPIPLNEFPNEHLPLIAKLVYESDRTLQGLAKHIKDALRPELVEEMEIDSQTTTTTPQDDYLPLHVVEEAISTVAERVNYGVDLEEKVPANLCVWRWELKDGNLSWLPKVVRDKVYIRMEERRRAKIDISKIFEALSPTEKDSFLKSKKRADEKPKHLTFISNDPLPKLKQDKENSTVRENPAELKKGSGRLKKEKEIDPECAAKEKDKADRKAARAEKEKRDKEAQNKSRSMMSAFFMKSKGKDSNDAASSSKSISSVKNAASITASSSQSDYEKAFKPFVVKANAVLAPINHFSARRKGKDVIVLDEIEADPPPSNQMNAQFQGDVYDEFRSFLSKFASDRPWRRRRSSGQHYKTDVSYSVREIEEKFSEAEVVGDTSAVRRLSALLASRRRIPAKVIIFHEDTRPGYFGTFTRRSTCIGPRTPFAKDAVALDYNYDSGEEWEQEEEGGDDLASVGSSDDDGSEGASSDLDGWLIDDDIDGVECETPPSERGLSPDPFLESYLAENNATKRKAVPAEEKKPPKKRKILPLVQFVRGPYAEDAIGKCPYEPFKRYRIQLFNDTPFPIDPFTFVSTPVQVEKKLIMENGFVVPPLPNHAHQPGRPSASTSLSGKPVAAPQQVKRKIVAPLMPKTPFPDALLPFLADKIASLATGNLTWLIESLYQDLKGHKVKKVAIEAKVREIAEKCSIKKVWTVKEDILKTMTASGIVM